MQRIASHPISLGIALVVLVAGGALVLLLVWHDMLPGGWTLRGWVEPHAQRAAREQRERSAARMALFRRENPGVEPGAVVFVGSSTIERWPLAESFPGARCVDRGIGNEPAGDLLARLAASLPGARPAGFVVYAASIDFRAEGAPPGEVAARAARVLDELERLHPGVPTLLLGLQSERDASPDFVERLRATNAALEALADSRGLAFLETARPPLTTPDGRLAVACSADDLHLDARGYAVLSARILEEGGPLAAILAATPR